MPKHDDKDKKPPRPSDLFKKASKHNILSAQHNEAAAKHFEAGAMEQAQHLALKAHAHQLGATKHLNEAIKHLVGVKGEGEHDKFDLEAESTKRENEKVPV